MSAPKLTKKQKKGLAFRERKGKKQDNLLDEEGAIPVADVPVDEEVNAEVPQPVIATETPATNARKRKHMGSESEGQKEKVTTEGDVEDPSKRTRKKQKVFEGGGKVDKNVTEIGKSTKAVSGNTRYILFVGNLKYTTSIDMIREHFAACDPPPQIRLLTPKPKSPALSTVKSKGYAFLEFSHRNALQQGLKLHGSTLDSRRINVELTAGGGGKSEKRVQKVQARNKQLLEERKTRMQKLVDSGGQPDVDITAPPQRHSTTSGVEYFPQRKRTWTVPADGEARGRGGAKTRGKKGKSHRDWGTGANAVAVG